MPKKMLFFSNFFVLVLALTFSSPVVADYDLTVVSNIKQADGLGQIAIGVIDLFKNDLKINCISSRIDLTGLNDEVRLIVSNHDEKPGTLSILFDPLCHKNKPMYLKVPNSKIKIAYSMFETTKIPDEWVKILNKKFDAVVVPDKYLVEVYKDSGVKIPIFELPIGMNLEDYFQKPKRSRPSKVFVFGTTVSGDERKNYSLLIQAFAEEFGKSKNVILKLNCRFGNLKKYEELIDSLGVANIYFSKSVLNKNEYIDFLDSFDCFVNLSKGEGFSLCPREALALGIPCILTRNTAQITLCDSGLVKEVRSDILEPAIFSALFGTQDIGCFFNCSKDDVKAAMREVYENYSIHLSKAKEGPKWVSQYKLIELKQKYFSLIKPKKVLLGNENIITNEYLMTNSSKLYNTYKKVFNLN